MAESKSADLPLVDTPITNETNIMKVLEFVNLVLSNPRDQVTAKGIKSLPPVTVKELINLKGCC